MTTNAMDRKLEHRFIVQIVTLNVLLEIIDIVNWLRAVEAFSRNHFAMLQFVLGENFLERFSIKEMND